MYRVEVINDDTGKVLKARHFTTKKRAEKYEDDQYKHNPVAWKYTFKTTKVKKES